MDWKGEPLPERGSYTTGRARIVDAAAPMPLPAGLPVLVPEDVELYVLTNSGARRRDRDAHDVRVLANAADGRGEIIDSQARVGGYPVIAPSFRAFDSTFWDIDTMLPKTPDALDSGPKGRDT